MVCRSIAYVISDSRFDPAGDPLIETDAFGPGAQCRASVRLRIKSQQDLAVVRPVGRLAAFRAEGEVVVDAAAEGLLDFGEGRALEGDHVAKPGDTTDEDPVIGLDGSEVALVFEHRHHSSSGSTPAAARKSRTARTNPRLVSGLGCGRWNTARTPPSAIRTRLPTPSLISAPTARNSASISLQRRSAGVGSAKI